MKQTALLLSLLLCGIALGHEGMIHTHHGQFFNYAAEPTITSVASGDWNNPETWDNGVPTESDRVEIPHEHNVWIKGDAIAEAVYVTGGLYLEDPNFFVGSILSTGAISVKGRGEVVFRDLPLHPDDAEESGIGLVCLGGTLSIKGAKHTSFLRLAKTARPGETELILDGGSPDGWEPGDRLFLPDYYRDHDQRGGYKDHEYATIASVERGGALESDFNGDGVVDALDGELLIKGVIEGTAAGDANGDGVTDAEDFLIWTPQIGQNARSESVVNLAEPLKHTHASSELHPTHVQNLDRDIVFRSENPKGLRGHVLAMGDTGVSVENAEFADLGRTLNVPLSDDNRIARYSFHLHHLMNSDWLIDGCAFVGGKKWGCVIHDTHYGAVHNNVAHDVEGAGFVLEDGSETGVRIDRNMATLINGALNFRVEPDPDIHMGFAGAGFWSRGSGSFFTNNVAANCNRGFDIWSRRAESPVSIPTDPNDLSKRTEIHMQSRPLLGFDNNTVYCCNTPVKFRGVGQLQGAYNEVKGLSVFWSPRFAVDVSYSQGFEFRDCYFYGPSPQTIKHVHSGEFHAIGNRIDKFVVVSSRRGEKGSKGRYDTNGNGEIDSEDYDIDTDGDGSVSMAEYHAAFPN